MDTPNEIGNASRSSAHAQGQRTADRKVDIKVDIEKTETVEFDFFLRLLLSQCLHDEKQSRFESIQTEIEGLRARGFDHSALKQTSKAQRHESIILRASPSNFRESELVKQRDHLLNEVLDQCLHAVLSIANNDNIRAMLDRLADLIQTGNVERDRYKSYADIYNAALRELAGLKLPSLRPPDIPSCVSRANPSAIPLNPKGATKCQPAFVRTAVSAPCGTEVKSNERETNGKSDDANIAAEPTTTVFTWPQVLSCKGTRAFETGLADRAPHIFTKEQLSTVHETAPHFQYIFVLSGILETSQDHTKLGANRRRPEPNRKNPNAKKTAHASTTCTSTLGNNNSEKNIDSRVQLAGYAIDMLSHSPSIPGVINTLIIDESLFLWHYDPQGSIHSDGISIIADFPRFLVVLLAFQRSPSEDWGIVPCLNPQALHGLGMKDHLDVVRLSMDNNHPSGILPVSPKFQGLLDIKLEKHPPAQSHHLSVQMIRVLKASAALKEPDEWVLELLRPGEGDVLCTAKAIALDWTTKMLDHLPELYFPGNLQAAGNTPRVRSISDLNSKGHGTVRVLVMNELEPLTTLTGEPFVRAWLDVVTCHAFLWKHGVRHSDPCLSSIVYDPMKQYGVLTDFDLSVVPWLGRVSRNDRTGTIPFMALELLSDAYWNGYMERCYHHELEALIWILSIVFLAYTDGKRNRQHEFTQDWFTSDYITCSQNKFSFLGRNLMWAYPSSDFTQYEQLMLDTCNLVGDQQRQRDLDRGHRAVEDRKRAKANSTTKDKEKYIDMMQDDTKESKIRYSEAMWSEFISILSKLSSQSNIQPSQLVIDRLKRHKPTFDISQCQLLFAQMQSIYRSVTETSRPCVSATNPSSVSPTT